MQVPVVNLKAALDETEPRWRAGLERVIERVQFILGPEGEAFEREFAVAMGGAHAAGVGSGTAALELALRAAGAPAGSEVLTSPLTAPFTGVAIQAAGMKLRLADIDPETLQLDPDAAGNSMRHRTKAIIPVHLYGQPCEMRRFARLAQSTEAVLIQDAAQAHGAQVDGRPLPHYSDFVCYSFYPTKNLGALGDGGAVVTNRAGIAARIRRMRDGGRGPNMVSLIPGINSRLDEIQAALLRAFLPRLAEWTKQRARWTALYDEALRDCQGVQLLKRTSGAVSHLYVVRAKRRAALRQYLAGQGIGSAIHYPVPLHLHPAFASCGSKRGDLPHAERACREVVSLPLWPQMSESEVLRVAEAVRAFY